MGILLGLTGAVSWGIADFAARFASRRIGAYRTLFFMQFFGFVALTAYLKFTGGIARGVAPGWQPWALAAFAGVLNTIASLSLYHSFRIGVMSVVAPISSCYPALTVALSLFSGERVQALRMFGLAVTLAGVVLAATSFAQVPIDKIENGSEGAADGPPRKGSWVGNSGRRRIWRAVLVSRFSRCADCG